jgi:anti-sigma B factor antagonist
LSRFSIDVHQTPGAVRVVPHGELDVATAPQLTQALDAAHEHRQRVLLDLVDVEFIDSSGITAVFLAWQHSRREGWALGMTNGSAKVMDVFEAVGLVDVLPFV